ncbi:CheR family methyltransferase [Histidinibacterium aquaticum]|uniref:Chemotaxis protein methyltransferase n=1 Tax=Histidinibacterium aquaticum TaxID=2613962 RepID=A0A5J5GIV4_9RHOB|nr:protein-glutamate O-methyltransferase [Histidinibacterium aquaticum]KAA9007970.1 chemotaxis protein [Histidinibacterium aquaticum]
MTTLAAPTCEFTFTEEHFRAIARLAHENFGLDLQPEKRALVYSRLTRRLRALQLSDFDAYLGRLAGPESADEHAELLSALTTNVTHFFREAHHFDEFRDKVLPGAIAEARAGGRIRFWSAGCSAGQEPYSIALTILDTCPDAASLDIRILATDVDPRILETARTAVYPIEERNALPPRLRDKMTVVGTGPNSFTVRQEARDLVRFGELNLIKDWPLRGPFQAVFCRNVAIYFDKPTQARLWRRFAPLIAPGGMLFIGHSERLSGPATEMFRSAGITSYQRLVDQTAGPEAIS